MLAEKNFQAMHTETSQYFYVEHDIGAADFIINDQHVRSKPLMLAENNIQAMHYACTLYVKLDETTMPFPVLLSGCLADSISLFLPMQSKGFD
jgi:hypothetical protein